MVVVVAVRASIGRQYTPSVKGALGTYRVDDDTCNYMIECRKIFTQLPFSLRLRHHRHLLHRRRHLHRFEKRYN
jgi:hypothetical protein